MGDIIQSAPLLKKIKFKSNSNIHYMLLDNFKETAKLIDEIDCIISVDFSNILEKVNNLQFNDAAKTLEELIGNFQPKYFHKLLNLSFSKLSAYLSYFIKADDKKGLVFKNNNEFIAEDIWSRFLLSIVDYREYSPFNLVDIYSMIGTGESGRFNLEPIKIKKNLTLGFVMGASSYDRRWAPENFALLAEKFLKEFPEYKIVLFGTKSEAPLGKAFFNSLKNSSNKIVNLIGKTNIAQLAEEIKNIDVLVSNDTGTMHLAWFYGKKVIELSLGPALYNTTGPYGSGHIVIQPEIECAPCSYKTQCKTLHCHKLVTVDTVMECLNYMLGKKEAINPKSNVKILETYFDNKNFLSFRLIYGALSEELRMREHLKIIWLETLENCLKKGEKCINKSNGRYFLIFNYIKNLKKLIAESIKFLETDNIKQLESYIDIILNMENELKKYIFSNFRELIPFYKYFEFTKNILPETDLLFNLKSLNLLYDILSFQISKLENKIYGGEYENFS